MSLGTCTITVYFEDPFWVGLYERADEAGYQVCRLIFGAEPKDYEVYETLLSHWRELSFSPALPGEAARVKRVKAGRARREAGRSLSGPPVGTRAQEALKLQREAGKEARREKSRQEHEAEAVRRFQLRQEKKRQKHKGR